MDEQEGFCCKKLNLFTSYQNKRLEFEKDFTES